MDRRTDFVIGGVQKGGTTALYDYMARDLSVSLSKVKETHFFDDENLSWVDPDYSVYHSLFDEYDGRPQGEATPIYLYWPQCLERIATYNPHMRLIFIFRDPIERAWSHWRMERARGLDDIDFSWAIRQGRERVANDRATPGFHRVFSYVERGFYGAQLAHALEIFPREQVLMLKSEDLQQDSETVLRRVADHLGLSPPRTEAPAIRANVGFNHPAGAGMQVEDVDYLAEIYEEDLDRFSVLSGLDIADWSRRLA